MTQKETEHQVAKIEKKQDKQMIQGISTLPETIMKRIEAYPENSRRPVNKTLFNNEYFQLTLNMRNESLAISSRGDLVYSAIPYDTARNYIQRAAVQTLLHPDATHAYIEGHKPNLETYLALSIFQVTGKKVVKDSAEVQAAYQQIFKDPLFEMQILGRLLQHDETGPLSANLAGKFLYSENLKTGISGYLSEYVNFVVQLTHALPIFTDGKQVQLLSENEDEARFLAENKHLLLNKNSDLSEALTWLPAPVRSNLEVTISEQTTAAALRPLLRSEMQESLSATRKNYVAHSRRPEELEQYFENVLTIENSNLVNVISDCHVLDGKLPFRNLNFNILVGDVSDSKVSDSLIRGIYVIGNHELSDVLSDSAQLNQPKWQPFLKYEWFKRLVDDPDEAWPLLPIGNHPFYQVVQTEIATRFPKVVVLNNEAIIHEGIRYIGLTIPVALVLRKKEVQKFIYNTLVELLDQDTEIPTVIVSHAPLFNELSLLSPESGSYQKDYVCSDERIKALFKQYNIIGAIHGHHHIPASSSRFKRTEFAGKSLFVVCSIYSKINTGFELTQLLTE